MSTETANLSLDAKRALLAQLLQKKTDAAKGPFPLSYGQKSWWFLYQLEPTNPAYNVVLPARIRTALDVDALRRAFAELVGRHAVLRMSFSAENGEPVQRVDAGRRPELEAVDASGWDEEYLKGRLSEEAHRPFDLGRGPVARAKLFSVSEDDHVLLMTVHHIAFDLWSLVVFMHELSELYTAEKGGGGAPLAPLGRQYQDYVRWQRQMLEGGEGERLWSYWRERLSGELPALNLPTSRPRPAVATYRGAAHRFSVGEETTRRLRALSQAEGATLYMTLLAAFQILLHRYSNQPDILVGSLVASGRSRPEFTGLVGFFDNQVVLRADLSANPTFGEFLAQVRQTVLGALEHQQYPFSLLVERLHPARDASRAPIFQSMFILQRAQLPEEVGMLGFGLGMTDARVELGELPLESVVFDRHVAGGLAGQLDLTLIVAELDGRLEASLQYNPDLFDAALAAQMAGHFQTLLDSVVADAGGRVAALPLLSGEERRRQLADWNDTAADYSALPCLHQMFEAQAERAPEAVAVVCRGRRLTYGELNERANRLAHYLRGLGVGPEVRVGISLERSVEMSVALLGVLKAGGAYVPLDPAYPQERLAMMLEDIGAPVLLTQQSLAATLPAGRAATVRLDADWEAVAACPSDNPRPNTGPGSLAYVIYTSGSTGRPKGVMIDHLGAANTIADINRRYSVTAGDRVLALSSLSFDLSVYDMLGTLAAGAAAVIPDPSASPDPAHWLELMAGEKVTVWNSAPALMEMFVEYVAGVGGSLPEGLRVVMMSGDWIPVSLPGRIKALGRGAEVHSLGGATEASIWSISFPVEEVDPSWKSIPYGFPMVNQRFHVLDAQLQPAPVGVVGELYIGGIGVARGYHNRRQLTAEKFIPDPFGGEPGARLYRTGDLGRYTPDGNIEFLGRIDGQVKIRGFRIELGEIEAQLAQHPSAREATVVVQTTAAGERRLVAYVVARTGGGAAAPTKEDLRGYLKERLPEYMVPSAFVLLDALPLTPNGKVARNALPPPEAAGDESGRAYVAPRTPTEETLAALWAEVLKVERVGAEDNFFELGGDSLLATHLVIRLRQALGEEDLPLHFIFESPTVAGLAQKVDGRRREPQSAPAAPPLRRIPRDEPLPLSFAQQRLWFLDQLVPGSPFYNVTTAVRFRGDLDARVLARSINEIVRRHETLRTTFAEVGGEPVQVVADALDIELAEIDLSRLPEGEREARFQEIGTRENQRSFTLSEGPLMRVALVRLGDAEHVMLLTIHHIVFDGWSFSVFLSELGALYEAYLRGEGSPLPDLDVQYADFAAWQREWLTGAALETHLDYWRRQLAGSRVLQLPSGRPRPAAQTFGGARQHHTLPTDLCESVKAFSRRHDATLFMTLTAALKSLLYRYTQEEDVVVGTPVAGRTREEIGGLIGFFLNALPLRTSLSGDPTFAELLGRVRRTALDAYAHQDIPFDKLVEELRPERSATHTPFFRVWFALQNAPMPSMSLPGLELSMLQIEDGTSKFDLVLTAFETEQGLVTTWVYNKDLFDDEFVTRMAGRFEALLRGVVEDADVRLNALDILTAAEKEQRAQGASRRQESNASKLKSARRRSVAVGQAAPAIPAAPAAPAAGPSLPLVIRPDGEEDLVAWAARHRAHLETQLLRHGGILLRGFRRHSPEGFERFAQTVCGQLFAEYGDLPRAGGGAKVYGSTPYPADRMILYHNESSHMHTWPQKIMFYCVTPAETGGETPIADGREIYRRLDPALRRRFEEKQLMYVRNFSEGLDVSWRDFFRTDDPAEVARYCRGAGEEFEFKGDGSLRTRKVRPAVVKHPLTGETVFFNQIQAHHVSCLDADVRQSILSLFAEENLPRNVYYGDGSRIEDSVVDELRGLYAETAAVFPWEEGDVVLLDNMLASHARNPFTGRRKIMVAMGDMVSLESLPRG